MALNLPRLIAPSLVLSERHPIKPGVVRWSCADMGGTKILFAMKRISEHEDYVVAEQVTYLDWIPAVRKSVFRRLIEKMTHAMEKV